jgi:hypothetical protein
VVDSSKFFYQFKTHPNDRPSLGVCHPASGDMLEYHGLPMGTGNSPALAGCYGLAFLRLLREGFGVFQGTPRENCCFTGFEDGSNYDPSLGHGYVLIGDDGLHAVLLWVHVDNFLLCGPSYEKTCDALHMFLTMAVDVGLLCHPDKLTPPQQIVKYCGFLYNTWEIPTQRIPVGKGERGLAMLDYILAQPLDYKLSCLSLSVVAWTLEARTEAAPSRNGQTYL